MHAAFDIDGTLDTDPSSMLSLMMALKSAGHHVSILTGCSAKKPTALDYALKRNYLNSMGMGHAYDELVVFGDPPHKDKAKWVRDHNVNLLFDNSRKNAKLASNYCTVLLPWGSRTD